MVKRGWQHNAQSYCAGTADFFVLAISKNTEWLLRTTSMAQIDKLNALSGKRIEIKGFKLQSVATRINPRTNQAEKAVELPLQCPVLEIKSIRLYKK